MTNVTRLAMPCVLAAALSCTSSTPAPTPAPTPATAPPAAAAPAQAAGGRGGRAGGPGGPARVPLTPEQRAARRDSLNTLRAGVVQKLTATIAGHENEPAGTVFKNVQLLKDVPAGQFLQRMDAYGRALSVGCATCHVVDQWDKDDKQGKKTARIMIAMVDTINTTQLSKLPAGRSGQTPRITCVTCHRGNGTPGTALLP